MRFNRRKRNFVAIKVICAFWALAVAVWNARPAEASPFAYVTDETGVVSMIDTAINEVVAAIPGVDTSRRCFTSCDRSPPCA